MIKNGHVLPRLIKTILLADRSLVLELGEGLLICLFLFSSVKKMGLKDRLGIK